MLRYAHQLQRPTREMEMSNSDPTELDERKRVRDRLKHLAELPLWCQPDADYVQRVAREALRLIRELEKGQQA